MNIVVIEGFVRGAAIELTRGIRRTVYRMGG
jgi:hypothetical protein